MVKRASFLGRQIEQMGQSEWFKTVGPKVVPRLDKVVHKLTGGRVLLSATFLPGLLLTTTGSKTGLRRTVPVATFREGDGFIVIASNFGRDNHPAWSGNLLKTPRATVDHKGEVFEVDARRLSDAEVEAIWPRFVQRWPAFATYRERTDKAGRDIRVFLLERVSEQR